MTATLSSGVITSTVVYRCSVEVGNDDEDKATDTKLIYVQKIRVRYGNDNLEKYTKMKTGDKLKVSVYGDDAYGLKPASKCSIVGGAEASFQTTDLEVTAPATAGDPTLICTLVFDTATNTPQTASYKSPAIKIVVSCTGDTDNVYDDTNKCHACSGNSYKHKDLTQFDPCKKCPAGKQPNSEKSDCEQCGAGLFSTFDEKCAACPEGKEGKEGFCHPCQEGYFKSTAGSEMCQACAVGSYSSILGSKECQKCPIGTHSALMTVGSTSCTACKAGTYQGLEGKTSCEGCADGSYSTEGSSECTPCPAGTKVVGHKKCEECDAGTYQGSEGQTSCIACADGSYSAKRSTTCILCPAGTKEVGHKNCENCVAGEFSLLGKNSCTTCLAAKSEYSSTPGSPYCLTCKGTISNNACGQCAAGERLVNGECIGCESGHISEAGSESCTPCPPGKKKNDRDGSSCDSCDAGTYQPDAGQDTCIPCNKNRGEFQPEKGSTYCKTTKPGNELKDGTSTIKEEVKCKKNTYSTGGAKTCTKCLQEKAEYTDSDGSTYCNICQGNIDSNGDCGAINCPENTIKLDGIGTGSFTFRKTSVGSTAEVPCKKDNTVETITRYCSYNPSTREGEWDSADSSKCSSEFTAAVNEKVNVIKTVDVTKPEESKKAVTELTELAQNASRMAPKDLSNIATSLDTFTTKLTEGNVEVDADQAAGLAATVGSVAGAGEEKLSSVTDTEKTQMRNCVTNVAKQLADSKPVETDTIAMQKISVQEVSKEKPFTLPKPKNDTLPAPKLTMKETLNADGEKVAPTVAVFDKKTAEAIFPKPSASSDDAATSETESSKPKNITYSIDSSIVSLEFAGTKKLDIEIEMSVDISDDAQKSNFELIRTCKFYNDTTEKWSTDGCNTRPGITSSSGSERSYVCACSHNTSFAIILSQAEIADTIQSTVSTVLNVINIVFLGITFLCIAPFKQFRARRLIQIQTQLCVALFVGHIAFILLGTTNASSKACIPGVIIVQYLFLVAVAWSVCASVTLYEKIVNALKSFGKQDKHYFVKCLAGCWTAPLFMVLAAYITSITLDKDTLPYVTDTGELDDDKTETCWVASPWKWVGFIIPVYLCLGINVVLFVMIARIIVRAGKSGSNSSGNAREVKAIMSIATTVCLPWLIALLMTGPKTMAQIFQWVFIIVTALQGPTMFICFVIFQEDVLTNLFKLVGKEPPQALLPAKSSKSTKSAASEISNVKPTTAAVKKEEKSDIVHVKNPEYNNPVQQQQHQSEENIYSKVDEEAPAEKDDTISRGSRSSKHLYESTSFTQHGDKGDSINPVPAVEQGETYENNTANDLDIAQNSYPHVPQLV